MACHEELYFGGWKKGNSADEVWKGTQLRGCKFVSVAIKLGRKRKVRVESFVVLVAFDVEDFWSYGVRLKEKERLREDIVL